MLISVILHIYYLCKHHACLKLIFKNANHFQTLLNVIFSKSQNKYLFFTLHFILRCPNSLVAFSFFYIGASLIFIGLAKIDKGPDLLNRPN